MSKHSIGLSGWLFLVLLVLKLTGTCEISWGWVTAPLWGTLILIFLGGLFGCFE